MKHFLRSLKFPFVFLARLGLVLLLLYTVGVVGCYKTFYPGDSKALILLVFACALCWPLLLFASLLVGVVYRLLGLVWWALKRFNRLCNQAARLFD